MKWLYGIVCLGFIIFFHELGHFIAARIFGVDVESFSLGFGPAILRKKIRATEYRLSLLPLGGYCGMKGEGDFRAALEAGLASVPKTPGSLYAARPAARAAIGFAGPLFNVIFAFLAFAVISITGYSYYSYSARVRMADEVFPGERSPAREAGLLTGDVIIEINGRAVENFSDIIESVSPRPDETLSVVVSRAGESLRFSVHSDFDKKRGIGKIGVAAFSSEPVLYEAKTYRFFPALANGAKQTAECVSLTLKGIASLFKGIDLRSAVSGPARIADMLGGAAIDGFSAGAREGLAGVLNLMAFISVSLFIMNLLPIPALDGGLVLFSLIELFSRRCVPPKIQYRAQFAGLAFVALLLALGVSSDAAYFIGALRKK